MGNRPTSVVFAVVAWAAVAACGAADNRVDPGDLALRDLLGIAPQVAVQWDEGQRAAARHVLDDALDGAAGAAMEARPLASGRTRSERIARTLAVADGDRAGAGAAPVPLVAVIVDGVTVESAARPARAAAALTAGGEAAGDVMIELWLSPAWDREPAWGTLPGRGVDVLAAFAADAGHHDGPVVVVPAPRLAVAAAYVAAAGDTPAEIMINPVVLAALEPDPLEAATAAGLTRAPLPAGGGYGAGGGVGAEGRSPPLDDPGASGASPGPLSVNGTGGNPYSFYGSVAECAFAQRTRCETCLAASNCVPVTDNEDGNAECTTLGADGGRGYFLLCVNLSLSIASVDACVADEAPACPRDNDAASRLAELANNANFLDDSTCALGLDTCLADIYGAPPNPFPGLDGGTAPADPPRDIDVSCGDSCDSDNNNGNVECNPSCGGGSGPSCNNAFSCDSACSSSNEQSGCGGNCEACNASSDSGGSSSSGCAGCDSDGSSSSSSDSGSCGSCDDNSSTGGGSGCGSSDSGSSGDSGCGDCGSSGGGGGGDSSGCGGDSCGGSDSSSSSGCGSGGGCGGGSDSGGSGCGSGGGGSGSSSCNVQRRGPPASVTLLIALMWGLLPIPAAALVRRRARRKARAQAAEPPSDAASTDEEVSS